MAKTKTVTRNPYSTLYQALTKIFSGPLSRYHEQSDHRVTKFRVDKYASRFKNASGQAFKRSSYDGFEQLRLNAAARNRAERYADFDQMEHDPLLASALDIYADEITTHSELTKILTVGCQNEEIKLVLENLYYNILNIESNLFFWTRTLCKYGDFFVYLDLDDKKGIQNTIALPTAELERLEGEDKKNPNYLQFQWNTAQMTFENWQVAHFRILGNDKFNPYGMSVLDSARRSWRALDLLENAMMTYRVSRSPERRVFYVDVGGIAPEDVDAQMEKVITSLKRNKVVDPETGKIDFRHNVMSIEEDVFLPVRGNSQTKVEQLPGGQYTSDIDDVKYMRDKVLAAIKIPFSYLTRGEGAGEDKTTLAQKDIRFARTVQRVQRTITSELEKIGIIHLYVLGYRGEDLLSFKVALNNPSKIAELQELEHWKTKFDVASQAQEGFFSKRWIFEKIFNISADEQKRNMQEIITDKEIEAKVSAIGAAVEEGGDLNAEGGGEEDVLLSQPGDGGLAPGKRKEPRITVGSKGKQYEADPTDKRGSGARKRSYAAQGASEMASSTTRNVLQGLIKTNNIASGVYGENTLNQVAEELLLMEHIKMIERLDLMDFSTLNKQPKPEQENDENETK